MSETISLSSGGVPGTPVSRIRYLGVGGAGAKFIELLATGGMAPDSLVVLGSDESLLRETTAGRKLLLQSRLLRGLGTGGDPEIGQAAAMELAGPIKSVCEGVEIVVLLAGLGGGTGTGAAPVVARLAHEAGALVLAFAVLPFACEGRRKTLQAAHGLEQLKAEADGVICLSNQKLFRLLAGSATVMDAFATANDVLLGGIRSVHQLVTRRGIVELKFATLCSTLRGRHAESAFATVAASGPDRVTTLVKQILKHPLLDEGHLLAGADAVLVSVTGGTNLGMLEIDQLVQQLQDHCGQAEVLCGADVDAARGDELSVTVIATKRQSVPSGEDPDAGSAAGHPPRLEAGSFDSAMGTTFLESNETVHFHAPSRLVPPPPELDSAQRWEVLEKQGSRGGRKRRGPKMKQGQLPLQIVSKGRFDKTEPTLHNGEDLDLPTYLRRGVALN